MTNSYRAKLQSKPFYSHHNLIFRAEIYQKKFKLIETTFLVIRIALLIFL